MNTGAHMNNDLQRDWSELGENAFAFEVLEVLKPPKDDPFFDAKKELKKLEEKWLNQLQPFGERGYNKQPAPREG